MEDIVKSINNKKDKLNNIYHIKRKDVDLGSISILF